MMRRSTANFQQKPKSCVHSSRHLSATGRTSVGVTSLIPRRQRSLWCRLWAGHWRRRRISSISSRWLRLTHSSVCVDNTCSSQCERLANGMNRLSKQNDAKRTYFAEKSLMLRWRRVTSPCRHPRWRLWPTRSNRSQLFCYPSKRPHAARANVMPAAYVRGIRSVNGINWWTNNTLFWSIRCAYWNPCVSQVWLHEVIVISSCRGWPHLCLYDGKQDGRSDVTSWQLHSAETRFVYVAKCRIRQITSLSPES